jgi:hypothetical protein
MKLGFWKLKLTAGIGNIQGIGPYGMLNLSDKHTQFGHFSHLDPPLSAMKLPSHREDLNDMTDSSWVSIKF